MQTGQIVAAPAPVPHGEIAFHKFLLQFSETATPGHETSTSLLQLFCQSARDFFHFDGAYFCGVGDSQELVIVAADGPMTVRMVGCRPPSTEGKVATEAFRQRRIIYLNQVDSGIFPPTGELHAKALMAVPVQAAGQLVGVAVFLSASDPDFFNDALAAQAAILADRVGCMLEARRPAPPPTVERQGLGEWDRPMQTGPHLDLMAESVADHVRRLLNTQLVCLLLREGQSVNLRAVSTESPQSAAMVRSRFDRKGLQFAADLAARALAAGEVISVAIDPGSHSLGELVPAGMLLAAPLHTSRSQGAVLVYPRQRGAFQPDEKTLLAAVVNFAASALENAELNGAARAESTHNLHLSEQHRRRAESLMELALELNSQLQLPEFARNFVTRAADLMDVPVTALAVKQSHGLEVVALHGTSIHQGSAALLRRLEGALAHTLSVSPEAMMTGRADELLGDPVSSGFGWNECTLVRLHGASGDLVGVLCLANRQKPFELGEQQLLQAIAAHASIALENARLFTRTHQANRHWIEIFDAISDFIVAHDQSEKVLRVNRSLADFIGVQPKELIGVKMSGLMVTDDAGPSRSCPFCRTLIDDEAVDEYVLPVLDRTYIVSTSRVHSANSEGLQTIHVLKDITDRREAERRYRELFDNIQEGVFFSTPGGRFVEVNDALVRMLGYGSREELLQADLRSQICVSAAQYDDFTRQLTQDGTARNQEQTLRRADGSAVHVLVNAFAVRDGQDRVTQYRGVMLDISGLKTFQSELQRERDFSGKILNHTQSLILVADTAGLISYANRRWYEMGYQQHQLLGRPLEDLIAPPRRKALAEALAATLAGQPVDNLELQIVRGQEVGRFSVNMSPMRDEQGAVTSIVVVMSDITDAATLQAKLMHAEKMAAVGQLVSGVAHEVNNPLTAILGFADLLMENPEMPEAGRKDLRVILQEAQRTKQIVQNLLSFARQMPPQKAPVQLNAILHRTVQLRAYDFRSRGAEVVEHLAEDLQQVIGDSHQLQQVFLNILNNAYDAVRDSGRSPRIEITTANRGQQVEIAFRDNGHGISSPERIFDPFFTTKDVGKGTGLGLSICYGIVHEHGGEIACQNNADGGGATFTVRLPALVVDAISGGMRP